MSRTRLGFAAELTVAAGEGDCAPAQPMVSAAAKGNAMERRTDAIMTRRDRGDSVIKDWRGDNPRPPPRDDAGKMAPDRPGANREIALVDGNRYRCATFTRTRRRGTQVRGSRHHL